MNVYRHNTLRTRSTTHPVGGAAYPVRLVTLLPHMPYSLIRSGQLGRSRRDSLLSIFDKTCPLCGSTLAVSATYCRCGFSFKPSQLEETAQALGLEAQEEELYETYLAARVAQAKETLTISRAHLIRDPEDPGKVQAVDGARVELDQAQHALTSQQRKLSEIRKAANAARKVLGDMKKMRTEKEREAVRQRSTNTHAKQAANALAARANDDIVAGKALRAKQPRTVAEKNSNSTGPVMTKMPGEAFRAQQTAKAVAAVRPTKAATPTRAPAVSSKTNKPDQTRDFSRPSDAPPPAAKHSATTSGIANADPTQRSQTVKDTPAATKTTKVFRKTTAANKCPHCTAEVAYGAERCRCGYQLISRNAGMVGLNVTDRDRKAMESFKKANIRIRKPD